MSNQRIIPPQPSSMIDNKAANSTHLRLDDPELLDRVADDEAADE